MQIPQGLLGGLVLPFLGRGYAGASPLIARNNIEVAHVIRTSIKLGDEVKGHIANGKDKKFIRTFLSEAGSVASKQEQERSNVTLSFVNTK